MGKEKTPFSSLHMGHLSKDLKDAWDLRVESVEYWRAIKETSPAESSEGGGSLSPGRGS